MPPLMMRLGIPFVPVCFHSFSEATGELCVVDTIANVQLYKFMGGFRLGIPANDNFETQPPRYA